MPTGYTYIIEDGDPSFEEFAMKCARAFLIECRDDNDPIPDTKEPDTYNKKQLEKWNKVMAELVALDETQIEERTEKEYQEEILRRSSLIKEYEVLNKKYKDMLSKVKAWEPPTKEHEGLKKFMIEQIKISTEYKPTFNDKITKTPPDEWIAREIKGAKKDIEYHSKGYKKDIERMESRNKWVKELKDSVK